MKLTHFYPNASVKDAANLFREHTLATALQMYENGWSIIGSYFKAPNLHQWKDPTKEQLKDWAISNFKAGRANSINLRLSDSQVIALDCDFPNEDITAKFIASLPCLLSIMPNRLYTCSGGKGCKIFFRYESSIYGSKKLPSKLGFTAYDPQTGSKHELEIKTTLSTVLGMHSAIGDENGRLIDYKVYGWYPNTRGIALVKPSELPAIGYSEIKDIQALYNNIVLSAGFVDDKGNPLKAAPYEHLLFASLCMFAQIHMWDECQERIPFKDMEISPMSIGYVEKAYLALGLADALTCLRHVFLGEELHNEQLLHLCELFKSKVLLSSASWDEIDNMASYADKAFAILNKDCMQRRARKIGWGNTAEDQFEIVGALMSCYENWIL